MKTILLLLLTLLTSCTKPNYTCEITIRHVAETLHNLPVDLRIGYETFRLESNQTLVLSVFKNVEHDVCITSLSAKNDGHTSSIEIYSGGYAGGTLIVKQRTIFENRPSLCALSILADNNCDFKVIR